MPFAKDIVGKWNLVESENVDEYLTELGVSIFFRNVAKTLKPQLEWTINGDEWKWASVTHVKSYEVEFKLGEQFDDFTPDNRYVSSLYTLEGDKLIQVDKEDDTEKESRIVREIKDGKLVIKATCGGITCTRIFERAEE